MDLSKNNKFKRFATADDVGVSTSKNRGFKLDLYDAKGNKVGKYIDRPDKPGGRL